MKNFKKHRKSLLQKCFFCLSFLLITLPSFATNFIDSDLSNQAGTNKNWHNSFWFFVCVALLLVVAYTGYKRKFIRIRRDYNPDQHRVL